MAEMRGSPAGAGARCGLQVSALPRRAPGRRNADFRFPQDEVSPRARDGWEPAFEDYLYVATTNGIAFSPTDAMPLTLPAKRLMALESLISVAAVLIIAARAVNVIGS
jgi:hypothetical protein